MEDSVGGWRGKEKKKESVKELDEEKMKKIAEPECAAFITEQTNYTDTVSLLMILLYQVNVKYIVAFYFT